MFVNVGITSSILSVGNLVIAGAALIFAARSRHTQQATTSHRNSSSKEGGQKDVEEFVVPVAVHASHSVDSSSSSGDMDQGSSSSAASSNTPDWKLKFNGRWKNTKVENSDEWFSKMSGFGFLVRAIAAKKLLTLQKEILVEVSPGGGQSVFHVERSFGGQEKYWKEHMPIGRTNNPAAAKASTCDGVVYSVHMWADETERILHMHFDPVDQTSGVRLLHSRRIIDDDHMEMVRRCLFYSMNSDCLL
jgi:hypothetical protein